MQIEHPHSQNLPWSGVYSSATVRRVAIRDHVRTKTWTMVKCVSKQFCFRLVPGMRSLFSARSDAAVSSRMVVVIAVVTVIFWLVIEAQISLTVQHNESITIHLHLARCNIACFRSGALYRLQPGALFFLSLERTTT